MAEVHQFPALSKEQLYGRLSPAERQFAERLLEVAPNYRYDRSGLPKLDPTPAPGVPSAAAAAKMAIGWLNTAFRDRTRGAG